EGAVVELGADVAHPIGDFDSVLPDYLSGHQRLYYAFGNDPAFDARVLDAVARARGRGRRTQVWPIEIVDPTVVLHAMRLEKKECEIALMRRPAEIPRDAHLGAMHLAAPGRYEYEIEALIRQVFRANGAERPAYGPIVGSGPNATILHYCKNVRRLKEGE